MNRKLTIIVTLFCLALVAFAEYESKEVTGMNGNTGTADNPVKLTYNKFVDNYSISASVEEGSGWEIGDSEIAPSQHWLLCGGYTEAGGDAIASEETSTAELFTVNLNGTLTKGGGGIGEAPKFFIQGVHEGTLALDREKEFIPVGETGLFTLKENGTALSNAYWRCYIADQTPPEWSEKLSGSVSLPVIGTTSPVPGVYTVDAKRDTSNDKDKQTSGFTYVGVASVSETYSNFTITSKTDNPGENETIFLPIAGYQALIDASPSPGENWPTGYPKWKEMMENL